MIKERFVWWYSFVPNCRGEGGEEFNKMKQGEIYQDFLK